MCRHRPRQSASQRPSCNAPRFLNINGTGLARLLKARANLGGGAIGGPDDKGRTRVSRFAQRAPVRISPSQVRYMTALLRSISSCRPVASYESTHAAYFRRATHRCSRECQGTAPERCRPRRTVSKRPYCSPCRSRRPVRVPLCRHSTR